MALHTAREKWQALLTGKLLLTFKSVGRIHSCLLFWSRNWNAWTRFWKQRSSGLKRWYGSCGWSRSRSSGKGANWKGQGKDTGSLSRSASVTVNQATHKSHRFFLCTKEVNALLTTRGMAEIWVLAFAISCVTNSSQLNFVCCSGLQQHHFQGAGTWEVLRLAGAVWQLTGAGGFQHLIQLVFLPAMQAPDISVWFFMLSWMTLGGGWSCLTKNNFRIINYSRIILSFWELHYTK